jgi:hypothetical protein
VRNIYQMDGEANALILHHLIQHNGNFVQAQHVKLLQRFRGRDCWNTRCRPAHDRGVQAIKRSPRKGGFRQLQ